jgi:hypothetical protein
MLPLLHGFLRSECDLSAGLRQARIKYAIQMVKQLLHEQLFLAYICQSPNANSLYGTVTSPEHVALCRHSQRPFERLSLCFHLFFKKIRIIFIMRRRNRRVIRMSGNRVYAIIASLITIAFLATVPTVLCDQTQKVRLVLCLEPLLIAAVCSAHRWEWWGFWYGIA